MLCILAKLMNKDTEKWQTTTKYYFAINMRRHIAPEVSVDYTGDYVALMFGLKANVTHDAVNSTTEFWRLCAESRKQMTDNFEKQDYLMTYFILNFDDTVHPMPNLDLMLDPSKTSNEYRNPEMAFTTSYGAWEFPTQNDDVIKPCAVFSNSSIHKTGPIFSQQLLTVNGKLTWTIGWSQRVVSKETAEEFADVMFAILKNAITK